MASIRDLKKRPKKVVNKDEHREREKKKTSLKKDSTSKDFFYSFLTMLLIFCLVQVTVSAILNVSKVVSYRAKIIQITKTRDAAMALNIQLKDSINNFSQVAGLEAIARNNLKMSSEDEVLVIINTTKDEVKEEKPKRLGFIKHD